MSDRRGDRRVRASAVPSFALTRGPVGRLFTRHLRVSFPRRVRSSLTRYTPASSPRPSVPRPLRG